MSALTAEQAALVAIDCVALPLLLLTLVAVLRIRHRRRRQPAASPPQLRRRPLLFLLLLHCLILTQLLPSLLSLLIPSSSFPCLALLIPVCISSHLLLFLLVVHYTVHYARTAVNTAVYHSLLQAFHPPSPPLRQAWTAKADSFSIAITAVNTATQSSPSRSPSSSPTSASTSLSSSRPSLSSSAAAAVVPVAPVAPASAHYQHYLSFGPFALLLLVGVAVTAGLIISGLYGLSPAEPCPAYPRLVIVQCCLLLLPAVALLRLWQLLRPLPSDYYGVKLELSLMLSLPLPLYLLSFALMPVSVPSAVLLLHLSLLLLSLTTTGLPLVVSSFTPALPAVASSPSSSSSSSVSLFHARLQRPSAALLSFLRSALKLPELSLLLSLRCFHSQFAPSAFHLSLRNPHLERIKHKKHRPRAAQQQSTAALLCASASTASSSRSSDAPALHLQTLLQSASSLFALHFLPTSWQPVPLPSALHVALASQLQSLSAEAADCSAAASVSRERAAGGLARVGGVGRERKKDAVQLLCELGELFSGVEKEVEAELAAVWLQRWLQSPEGQAEQRERELELQPTSTTTPSPTSSQPSSRSSADSQSDFASPRELAVGHQQSELLPSADSAAAAAAFSSPDPAPVLCPSRGSLAHLQALHLTSQSRRDSHLHYTTSSPPSSQRRQAVVVWEAGETHAASRLARGRSASVSVLQADAVARPDRQRRSSDSTKGSVRPELRPVPPSEALLSGLFPQT